MGIFGVEIRLFTWLKDYFSKFDIFESFKICIPCFEIHFQNADLLVFDRLRTTIICCNGSCNGKTIIEREIFVEGEKTLLDLFSEIVVCSVNNSIYLIDRVENDSSERDEA